MNAGQQCISPDYVLIEEAAVDKFLAECRKVIAEFYGKEPKVAHASALLPAQFDNDKCPQIHMHVPDI